MQDIEKLIQGFEHTHNRYVSNHIQNAKFNSIAAMRVQLKNIQLFLYFHPEYKDDVYKRLMHIIGCAKDDFETFYFGEVNRSVNSNS